MENQFQAEVCGSNYWWNPARSMFSYSPCSSGGISEFGGFGLWPNDDLLDMKTRSGGSASDGSSIVIQDHHIQNQQPDSVSGSSTSSLSMDSTLEILGIGLSSSSSTDHHWNNPANLFHGRSETTNYPPILQEHRNSSMNYGQETGVNCPSGPIIQKDWSTDLKNFSNQEFSLESPNSTGFPISSVSYGYSSTLLQTLFDSDPQPQQSLYGNGSSMNHPTNNSTNYLPKTNHFQFLNNTTNFSNAYSAPPLNDFRPNLFAPSTFNQKASLPNLKSSNEEVKGLGSVAKKTSNSEPAFKRPRIETPSPLPTFKVRKEKLGDRITALQQLVSPFGKTDTASVLHEAIEYIKFLHDQVSVLSTPYLRNGSPIQQRQQTCDIKTKDQEGAKQDLKSRGLCLVPISSTFPVAAETTTDFWTPTFGGTFR